MGCPAPAARPPSLVFVLLCGGRGQAPPPTPPSPCCGRDVRPQIQCLSYSQGLRWPFALRSRLARSVPVVVVGCAPGASSVLSGLLGGLAFVSPALFSAPSVRGGRRLASWSVARFAGSSQLASQRPPPPGRRWARRPHSRPLSRPPSPGVSRPPDRPPSPAPVPPRVPAARAPLLRPRVGLRGNHPTARDARTRPPPSSPAPPRLPSCASSAAAPTLSALVRV